MSYSFDACYAKIRCSMALLQNQEDATNVWYFCIKESEGSIRDANSLEEFVKVVKEFEIPIGNEFIDSFNENDFSEQSAFLKVRCYLNIAYKYAGNEINTDRLYWFKAKM